MTKRIVRLGLCGAGRWGKRYLETVRQNPNLEIKALFSRNPESKTLVPETCFVTPKWIELLENQSLDGVVIATPPSTHFEIASAAINKKIPCMIEKPLTLEFKQAQDLFEMAKNNQALILVDHIMLFNPAYKELKKRLEGEKIEEIYSEGANWGPFRPDYTSVWDYGAHDIALCLDLLGAKPTNIAACATTTPQIMEDGHAGSYSMELTWATGTKAFIKSSNVEKTKARNFQVKTRTRKFIFDDLAKNPLTVWTGDKSETVDVPGEKPLNNALNFFADAIRGEIQLTHPLLGLNLGLNVVNVLDQVEKKLVTT